MLYIRFLFYFPKFVHKILESDFFWVCWLTYLHWWLLEGPSPLNKQVSWGGWLHGTQPQLKLRLSWVELLATVRLLNQPKATIPVGVGSVGGWIVGSNGTKEMVHTPWVVVSHAKLHMPNISHWKMVWRPPSNLEKDLPYHILTHFTILLSSSDDHRN